jgi:hypothetical protein
MNRYTLIASGALCALIWSQTSVALSAPSVLTVPNSDPKAPPCVVMLAEGPAQCTSEGCAIPLTRLRDVKQVQLMLSCVPTSSPTGFENPPPYVELHSIRAKNAQGHLSVVDDTQSAPSEQMRELNFCLWGNSNILCGFAKIPKLAKDPKSRQRKAIQAFIRGIEFTDPLIR